MKKFKLLLLTAASTMVMYVAAFAGDTSSTMSKGGCTAQIQLHASPSSITGVTVASVSTNITTSVSVRGYEYKLSDPTSVRLINGNTTGSSYATKTINPDTGYKFYATAYSTHSFKYQTYSDSKNLSINVN